MRVDDHFDRPYHESWNDLIPVLTIIQELGFKTSLSFNEDMGHNFIIAQDNDPIAYVRNKTSALRCVYQGVLLFLKWYNLS